VIQAGISCRNEKVRKPHKKTFLCRRFSYVFWLYCKERMLKSIPIVVLGTLLLFAHNAEAITRQADKECLLCHVLWFDVFKTDQKTLLEQKDSPIVIAGSTGLASSEQMCVTCHDGYVVDSRVKVVAKNPHHSLKKVPEGMDLPEIFRLDRNNEIYCGTCHTLHDFQDRAEVGSTPFMRMDNKRSQMCIACHQDKTHRQGQSNHPLFKNLDNLPRLEAVKMGSRFGPSQEIICQTCHKAHGRRAMVTPVDSSMLCLVCHQNNERMIDGKHDLRITRPDSKNIKRQLPSESGPCGVCHIPHRGVGKRLWARQLPPGNQASQMCLSCHDTKTASDIRPIGAHSHPVDVKPGSNITTPDELPLYLSNSTRDPDGSVQCLTCHAPHKWDPNSPSNKGGKDVEGDSSNSFLRISNEFSKMCLSCHSDKKQILISEHNLRVMLPEEKNIRGLTADAAGPCGACHIPHNAVGQKLWARRLNPGNVATQMCLSCHGEETGMPTKRIGEHSHPVNVKPISSKAIPAELPLFLDDTAKALDGKVQCFTCHNVHQWAPDPSVNSTKWSGKNIEGDASNSFLRISNNFSSGLCLACHADKKQVQTSDHNLQATAPDEKNINGLTADVSGPCGACHIPHNASGKRLWAKPLSGKKDYITQLCSSCHNQGGAAKAKLVGDNYHPVDVTLRKLNMTEVAENDLKNLPLYDSDGNKTTDDKMVCTTCHDPHTWDPNNAQPKPDKPAANLEGDPSNSFLRKANFPTSALCKICHPDEAFVGGTVHDLSVSAPEANNLLGQTAKRSGPCGACHLVHNAPPDALKLWARPTSPVHEGEHVMDALCRSCHSKGNLAENKVPLIAFHPGGRLVNNILRFNQKSHSYTRIFDNKGREVNAGQISCPSCHDAHQRGLVFNEKGSDKKLQKKGSTARFLRTESYNIVCVDCHGPDGIFRYLYFHQPDKRIKQSAEK
jgi:predicted CXXCH cytochrome family protein